MDEQVTEAQVDIVAEAPVPKPKNRGGRPKRAAQAAPDLQAMIATAVSTAVAEATARIFEQMGVARAAQPAPVAAAPSQSGGDLSFARELALQFVQLADQGSKTKRVDPAELEQRRFAREEMERLIIDARVCGLAPEYQLSGTVYLDEVLVPATYTDPVSHRRMATRIEYWGVPNEAMKPANQTAHGIVVAFMRSIGGQTPAVNTPQAGEGTLKVLHRASADREAPQVGRPRRGEGMKIIGRGVPGEMVETNVLGTVASPARQVA